MRNAEACVSQLIEFEDADVVAESLDEIRCDAGAWSCLSPAEQLRAARFARETDRRRYVLARARLRQGLAERLGVDPREVTLTTSVRGKTMLGPLQARSGWRFSLACCSGLALFAFARGREVGVDVARLRQLPEADAIAARMLSPRERIAWEALPPIERPEAFFRAWTRKEAVARAHGGGLSVRMDCIELPQRPGEPARLRDDPAGRWEVHGLSPRPGYVAAVALGC